MLKATNIDRTRAGFALPIAVLALVVVGALVTAGFFMARQEGRIGIASKHAGEAFYIAEQGMNEVLANWSAVDYGKITKWTSDTVTGSVARNTADTIGDYSVAIYRLTDKFYWLESEGQVTEGNLLAGARRRMGVVAKINTAWIDPQAALTTRGQTTVGGTAEVNGTDSIPDSWEDLCSGFSRDDKPGILAEDSTIVDTSGSGQINGDPSLAEDSTINDSTFTVYGDLTWEDLTEVASTDGIHYPGGGTLSVVVPQLDGSSACDYSQDNNWGEPYQDTVYTGAGKGSAIEPVWNCQSYFPLVWSQGDLTIQGNSRGQGMLLVGDIAADGTWSGDLDLRGDFTYVGLIIVLGTFETQSADPKVFGAVLAGNADFDTADQDIIGGSVVQYSSCGVNQAILNNASLAKARPLNERSWVDLSNIAANN